MHADLEHLIRLQKLDTASEEARRTIAALPERLDALDARLEFLRGEATAARERLDANQVSRRALEKDLAVVQTRLSRFKDQLMEVKTNREYLAMQKEIETAQHDVQTMEGRILERMLEADELAAALRAADAQIAEADRAADVERRTLEDERLAMQARLEETARERQSVAAGLPAATLAVFEQVSRARKGIALSEARDGLCSECHVRVRPQIYAEVKRNDRVIQCESCQRILYHVPPSPVAGASS